ncbi:MULTISPECIES: bifunctional prephenate dehydrogenase/3-phosphoshikimate 1-carboxyvinyltransferase [unclassified Marinobacter]|jgi:3-phosphoshikimate 1-carboxyvinyltransferase|uniref:bifunctional prephenate dehydrogenase/3-phosphoshikimate 1-carboxyvinyltransferase n=1 Tax=unclassified Marinobacter TaxID=83889 RepID=UPI00200E85A2|nr:MULTISPECIES: bifunctional prephenate dehydrogenase/3-phosphoshikimate 1-carboxyvinyltransferase [unclassified Marinobacter]MCL1480538.1 bifunctional prephenate dehydrogenase/3-phosphoshikimate 1-carboxyvinyltransferase [Marinobacter sp.]MCL1484079.1 bifunctional prephenate dehydrogenase/3-phosphoshikimate 1-carboxyvinyltransferase [Marinobacter sp.]UQG57664.1 bifunctional prephenate dehydrogenase/3-phosphoshikimate 1-carboxyvinyltransferase [Marinobacter sp. M4C]UQG66469.1 bifunctional prep
MPIAQLLFQRVAVIGLGLIGGSLAAALRENKLAEEVVGFDTRADELGLGVELGVIDSAAESAAQAVSGADLVVLAVPVKAIQSVLREIQSSLKVDAVITDVGSTKSGFVNDVRAVLGHLPATVIPGHPIAGSEKSGIRAANPQLFAKHKVILTPADNACPQALGKVTAMWRACDANVLTMAAEHHDEVLAATSHLPHLIAFSLVDTLAGDDQNMDIFRYAAGGFRDFTRIAASDPVMWRDIFLSNRDAVLLTIDRFTQDLDQLRSAIADQDGDTLLRVFTRARAAREHFSKMLSGQAYVTNNTEHQVTFRAQPAGPIVGDIRVPGDKSMSHRSIMLGALAEGITEVNGFLEGEDSLATVQAFRDMGVTIEGPDDGFVRIHGVGMNGLQAPRGPIYLGNSGTGMRLFSGLLAAQAFDSELVGDASLTKRPMGRVADPLRAMGAVIDTAEGGRPPLKIRGNQPLTGFHYDMPVASAQVKSCLLLAGLYADGVTSVTEPAPTRDHTERMLEGFGYHVYRDDATSSVSGGGKLVACNIDVPADISSAAFFLVAGSIAPGSDLTLRHVGMNPTRVGVINILRLMGANIDVSNERAIGGEPVADVRVRYALLKGIDIPEREVPLAIDEFPVLFIAATFAEGRTTLRGAEELRVKESDRIQVMADGLAAVGVKTTVTPDGIIIDGGQTMTGGIVNSHGDHRIAMSFAVASLRAKGEIVINDCANVATSFPGFVELAQQVGMNIQSQGGA